MSIFADVSTTEAGLKIDTTSSSVSARQTIRLSGWTKIKVLSHCFIISFQFYSSLNFSIQASFAVLPAVIEVPLECFQYWIIVVSVVAGLLALLILIAALACVSYEYH